MFIKTFSEISKTDVEIAGGKGASLGEMASAGFPVPPGFVVLTNAFEAFLEAMSPLEETPEKIRASILSSEMPLEIASEIERAFDKLGAEFVAVRSSATAEDGAEAAWAGQLETYLNTVREDLMTNVKKCWASLFTLRAIAYGKEMQQGSGGSNRVAVVVQRMVQSEVSGVAFSVHPVTQDRSQLVIEAGWGLGEAIVSGSITPDSYVVDKADGRIMDANVSEQERMIGEHGWEKVPAEKRASQKLSNNQIVELSKLVVRIENHYGFPVDVEWALEGDKFYITQSRPITTLSGLV